MKLVMIHGRAQAGRVPEVVKKEWLDALGYGLLRAEKTLPAGTTVELPFYGDELESMVQAVKSPLGIDATAKGTATDADKEFRGEMLEDIAAALGVTRGDIEREYTGQPQQKGPENWEWVQAILRAVDRVPGLNSSAIDLFTRDVYVYLTFSWRAGKDRPNDKRVDWLDGTGRCACAFARHDCRLQRIDRTRGDATRCPPRDGRFTSGDPRD